MPHCIPLLIHTGLDFEDYCSFGMVIMAVVWLYREYNFFIYYKSVGNLLSYLPQPGKSSTKINTLVLDVTNQLSKVTAEKRRIIKSMMVLIENMRSMLEESNNLLIPFVIPLNDSRNEEMILANMKKLKQNIKKVCEKTSKLSVVTDNENSQSIMDELNLLKEANQNLKRQLQASQKETKIAQKKAQSEINVLNNDLARHKQQNIYVENELKDLKKKNRDISERISASTRTIEDLKCKKQQLSGRIMSFRTKITNLDCENGKLKLRLEKSKSIITKESNIAFLENANKTLEMEILRLREENECSICCEEVNRASDFKWEAFIPCGHRFCSKCARDICSGKAGHNQRICPNCRTDVQRILTVYDT